MVIKQDLCDWFASLDACKRIDYMCGLLYICTPLELRFIGSVVEDLAKKDFHFLRDSEIKANQAADVSNFIKAGSLADQQIRSKINVTLALLNSTNSSCAEIIFNLLERQFNKMVVIFNDKQAADEILLILTMAVHHPAFKFAQHSQLGEELCKAQEYTHELYKDEEKVKLNLPSQSKEQESSSCPASLLSRQCPASPEPDKAMIKAIEVKDAKQETQNTRGGAEYQIHTTWSNGDVTEVYMQCKQLQDIHYKLLHKFPEEKKQHKSIPVFPGRQKHKDVSLEVQISSLNQYLSHLVKAPAHILDCEILTEPLRNGTLVSQEVAPTSTPNSPSNVAATVPTPQPHALFMQASPERGTTVFEYGSVAAPSSYRPPMSHGSPNSVMSNSQCSPGPSQRSSTTNSPANSRTSSPAPPPQSSGKVNFPHPANKARINPVPVNGCSIELSLDQLLRLLGLEKYSDNLRDYSFKQIISMSKEEFAKAGLPPDAQSKLRSTLDQLKQTSQDRLDQNGLIDTRPPVESIPSIPYWSFAPGQHPFYQAVFRHPFQAQPSHLALHPSPHPFVPPGDSSPANSEASSPSPSPLMHQVGGPPPESIQGHPVNQALLATVPPHPMMSPPSAIATDSFKNSKSQHFDSSGSEEDRGTGYNQESAPGKVKGHGRPQQSQSLPVINQSAALVSALDETKVSAMSNSLSAPHNHPTLVSVEPRSNNTPPLPNLPVPIASASLHLPTNGYISDPPPHQSQGPHNALPRTLSNRPHSKQPILMQKSVPMPLAMQPQNLGKNGGGPILHPGPPHSYFAPPSASSVSTAHLMAMPPANLQTNSNALHVIQQQHPPPSLEGGAQYPIGSFVLPPHGILTTVANSTAIMTTTQSHPSGPPLSHSPSPVGTGDQVPTAPCIVSAEAMDPTRPEGRSLTPPSHTTTHFNAVKSQSNTSGPNSGTPSPPLVSTVGGRNQPIMIPYFYLQGNGLMPPLFQHHPQGHQPQQQPFPNGLTHEHYLAGRYPPQLNPNQIALMYGNSVCSPHNQPTIPTATAPNTTVSVQNQSTGKGVTCYNCGQPGHKAPDCKENTMDNMSNNFRLSFKPKPDSE